MSTKIISFNLSFVCACFFLCFASGVTLGQGGGGDTEPRPPETGGSTGQFETVDSNLDQNTSSGSGGSSVTGAGEGVGELGSAVEFEEFDDTRNQGFVGATADRIQESGFIGRSVLLGSPLAEGASFGGGVNDVDSNQVNIGGTAAGGRGGFGATGSGVQIIRRSMRSRVRPSFDAPKLSQAQVSGRFERRMGLQPSDVASANSYSVSLKNRTATLSGSVGSKAESDRVVRQLRLEPGVYKVINRLKVVN
ncbi:MAG: BON domain-containing protein [Mariniblastus sp.]|nr:BON domain-containing protein [Mariniblastus sp.]MDG2181259.1 BON domain-containing protein [Mariniblastus sp.]